MLIIKKFHTLRHTYATKQFEDNTPLKTASELLSHTDIYLHPCIKRT